MNGHTPRIDSESKACPAVDSKPHDTQEIDPEPVYESGVGGVKTPDASTPDPVASPVTHPPVREDLQDQEITSENAQSYFSPQFCVFVGNLTRGYTAGELESALYAEMKQFGPCYVKSKSVEFGNMPLAFVQYEDQESTEKAMNYPWPIEVLGRVIRLEITKANRTAHIGYHSGKSITVSDIEKVLKPCGSLEELQIRTGANAFHKKSTFGIVSFHLYGDYANALQKFRQNREFYLVRAMDEGHLKGPGQESRSLNQPSNRNWNNTRYNNRKPWRPWNNGNGNMGNGGNGGAGGNSAHHGRGGYRNGPGHRQGSFTGQHTSNPGFNTQNFPSPNHPNQHYNANPQFTQGFAGGNNFGQGYHPNVNQNFPGNFPQGPPGNLPSNYPQGYSPVGVYPNAPVFFNQVPEVVPPPEYPATPNPGFPMFVPSPYPPNTLPPMMAQPQATVGLPFRRPPFPSEPLIVSSQPQYDTDRHRELYYYPADQGLAGIPAWVDPTSGYYMQQNYNQYQPIPSGHSRHPSIDESYAGTFPQTEMGESTLAQMPIRSIEQTDERGCHMERDYHSNTDGSSDLPPHIPPSQSQSEPYAMKGDMLQDASFVAFNQPVESQSEPNELENDSNERDIHRTKSHGEPAQYKSEPMEPQTEHIEHKGPRSGTGIVESEHAETEQGEAEQVAAEIKSLGGTETSDDAPGLKTPDTDESQELAALNTAIQSGSQSAIITHEPQSSDLPTSPNATTPENCDKGKGKSPAKVHARMDPKFPGGARAMAARASFAQRKKLKEKYQPKTDTGKSIEQYTREAYAEAKAKDPSLKMDDESLVDEVIQELEEEWRQKGRKKDGLNPHDESQDEA